MSPQVLQNIELLSTAWGLVDFSSFHDLVHPVPFQDFSVKYVRCGREKYTVNGNIYHVKAGDYLLANHHAEGFIEIDSETPVQGICIALHPSLLSEVMANFTRPDTPYPDIDLDTFFGSAEFLENQYSASNTQVGAFLLALDRETVSMKRMPQTPTNDFFFTLAEKILADHIPICKQLQSIKTLKATTRKELLRRVQKGKEYMDSCFSATLDIKAIAKESSLSEYYFYRLFKTVYGVSPHRYLVQKRLDYAKQRIGQGNDTLSDIAGDAGFSDIHAFSKSFKKHVGIAPSRYSNHTSAPNTSTETD